MSSDVIFVQFADNGNVRMWNTEPFFGGIRIKLSKLIHDDLEAFQQRVRSSAYALAMDRVPHAS